MKKSKREELKKMWVENTQMFQRIVGTPVTSSETLEEEWENMKSNKIRERSADSASIQLLILKMASEAGHNRKN